MLGANKSFLPFILMPWAIGVGVGWVLGFWGRGHSGVCVDELWEAQAPRLASADSHEICMDTMTQAGHNWSGLALTIPVWLHLRTLPPPPPHRSPSQPPPLKSCSDQTDRQSEEEGDEQGRHTQELSDSHSNYFLSAVILLSLAYCWSDFQVPLQQPGCTGKY